MKIALLFYGVKPLECINQNAIQKFNIKDYTINHWKEYVLNEDMDIFIHSWSLDYKDIAILNYKPKDYIFEKQIKFSNNYSGQYLRNNSGYGNMTNEEIIKSKYYSMCKVINLMNCYEEKNNIEYDLILISRMDLLWFNKIDLKNIDPKHFYTSNWNYAFDKYSGRNLIYNNKLLPLDHFFITNSKDVKLFGKLYDELDKFIHLENPHYIILEYLCYIDLWKKHKTIYYTFYDHLLLRAVFSDSKHLSTDEWKGFKPEEHRKKILY